jgi:hypothetical protein
MPIVAALIALFITSHIPNMAAAPAYCKHGVHVHLIWGQKPCIPDAKR